jgi:hypothetical protein
MRPLAAPVVAALALLGGADAGAAEPQPPAGATPAAQPPYPYGAPQPGAQSHGAQQPGAQPTPYPYPYPYPQPSPYQHPYAYPYRPPYPQGAAQPPQPPAPAAKDPQAEKPLTVEFDGETETAGARTLRGHTFPYPHSIDSAFTTTNFYVGASVQLYNQADVPSSFEVQPGIVQEFSYDRDLVFVGLRFGTDFTLFKGFTAGLDADYLAEVGTNEDALFLYGGNTGYEFRPNVRIRLFRSESSGSQLTLRPYASIGGGIRALPQGLLREIAGQLDEIATDATGRRQRCLAEGDFECAFGDDVDLTDSIQLDRTRNGGGGALTFAQALGRAAGVQVSAGLEGAAVHVEAPFIGEIDAGSFGFYAGIAPSLNFYPTVPIALSFEYRFELDKSGFDANPAAGIGEDTSVTALAHQLNWGLYFTGRRDLMIGWILGLSFLDDAERSLARAKDDPVARIVAFQFDLRYFF